MADLSAFPITARWPAKYPDQIQLYSATTPNGVKISIALEEIGLPYEPHLVNISKDESWTPEFLSLNPNGKIPAIIDPNGPDGKPIGLFESGAILLYLADKRPLERYRDESRRLIGVLDGRLKGRKWIMGNDYTIADIASLGWVRNLIGFYEARDLVGFDNFKRVAAWLERGLARPAVQRGLTIPKRP
jgi:GST-like protein